MGERFGVPPAGPPEAPASTAALRDDRAAIAIAKPSGTNIRMLPSASVGPIRLAMPAGPIREKSPDRAGCGSGLYSRPSGVTVPARITWVLVISSHATTRGTLNHRPSRPLAAMLTTRASATQGTSHGSTEKYQLSLAPDQ